MWVMSRQNKFDAESEHDWGISFSQDADSSETSNIVPSTAGGISPDPADPCQTFRVLTLRAASDLLLRPSNP
jgi:hypothetical protein